MDSNDVNCDKRKFKDGCAVRLNGWYRDVDIGRFYYAGEVPHAYIKVVFTDGTHMCAISQTDAEFERKYSRVAESVYLAAKKRYEEELVIRKLTGQL